MQYLIRTLSLVLALSLFSAPVWAQSVPDSGAILRESTSITPTLPELPPPPRSETKIDSTGPRVLVKSFAIRGAARFSEDILQAQLRDLLGQALSFDQLQSAADRISLYYRQNGLHALALLPEQSLGTGVVEILVVEGKVGQFLFERPADSDRLPRKLLTEIIERGQEKGAILDVDALERATLIANDVPGLKVTTVLKAGGKAGETDVLTQMELQPIVTGNLSADNFDPPSTGRNKLVGAVSLNNPLGIGDQFTFAAQHSSGKDYSSISANLPLNSDGLRASITASRLDYEALSGFSASGSKGKAATETVQLNYPLIRQQQLNVLGQLGYSQSHLVSDSTTGNTSDKKNRSWTVGLSLNHNDGLWGGGVSLAGFTYASGTIDLSGNAGELDLDATTIRRNGHFAKLSYNAARLQRLGAQSLLWLSTNGQIATKNLDPAEEFSLGGPNAVRAYPSLEASGDEGQVVTLEYRHELPFQVRGKLFYDWGRTRINHDNNFTGGTAHNLYSLQGAGFGIDWTPYNQWSIRASMAWRIGENPAPLSTGRDNDGSKRIPQFWLNSQLDF